MKKRFVYLIIIITSAFVLRFWALGSVPFSLDRNEVSLGYNAYSLLHTGRDAFGAFSPSALYSYLTIPSIAVFGLTSFAVRLPSVILGILGVFIMYFLSRELCGALEKKQNVSIRLEPYAVETFSLLSAFLLALSPWQLQFSRTASEANLGLTMNLLVGLFFLKGLKKPWMLLLAAFFAGLNIFAYQREWIFTLLLIWAFVFIYWKEIVILPKKYLVGSMFICLLFISANLGSLERISGITVSQPIQSLQNNSRRLADDKKNDDFVGISIDNKNVIYSKELVAAYLSQFDPNFLFLEGDTSRQQVPEMGLVYFFDLPFLFIGISTLLFGKYSRKTKFVIFSWLLLAPVPAAMLFDTPNPVMTMNMLPMLIMLIALGYIAVFSFLLKTGGAKNKGKGFHIIAICLIVFFAGFNFVFYLNQYFVQLNYFNMQDWQYGYSQVVPQIEKIQGSYKKIIVSNKKPMDQSYLFFLFSLRYPPLQYQQLTTTEPNQFGKYTFRSFNWDTEKNKKDVLYVGTVNDFPKTVVAKEIIYYPDGKPAILLVDPTNNL